MASRIAAEKSSSATTPLTSPSLSCTASPTLTYAANLSTHSQDRASTQTSPCGSHNSDAHHHGDFVIVMEPLPEAALPSVSPSTSSTCPETAFAACSSSHPDAKGETSTVETFIIGPHTANLSEVRD